jgi:hypothetical protein
LSGTRQRLHRHPQLVTARAQNLLLLLPRALEQMPPTGLEVRRARQSRWAPHLGQAGEVQSSALLTSSIWYSSCASAWTPRCAQTSYYVVALIPFRHLLLENKTKKISLSVRWIYPCACAISHVFGYSPPHCKGGRRALRPCPTRVGGAGARRAPRRVPYARDPDDDQADGCLWQGACTTAHPVTFRACSQPPQGAAAAAAIAPCASIHDQQLRSLSTHIAMTPPRFTRTHTPTHCTLAL